MSAPRLLLFLITSCLNVYGQRPGSPDVHVVVNLIHKYKDEIDQSNKIVSKPESETGNRQLMGIPEGK